jgi:hypothetical protein
VTSHCEGVPLGGDDEAVFGFHDFTWHEIASSPFGGIAMTEIEGFYIGINFS